jgi:hypothetical protein
LRTKELRAFNWEELDLSKVEDNGFDIPFTESLVWNAPSVAEPESTQSGGGFYNTYTYGSS